MIFQYIFFLKSNDFITHESDEILMTKLFHRIFHSISFQKSKQHCLLIHLHVFFSNILYFLWYLHFFTGNYHEKSIRKGLKKKMKNRWIPNKAIKEPTLKHKSAKPIRCSIWKLRNRELIAAFPWFRSPQLIQSGTTSEADMSNVWWISSFFSIKELLVVTQVNHMDFYLLFVWIDLCARIFHLILCLKHSRKMIRI